jgi:pyruvate/2-oxoglutarate/acetoin dehydrogenase E1 component
LQADEPALVIERLNGYRQKERLPVNIDTMTLPLGQVEIITEGSDLTIVTYGACVEIAQQAIQKLSEEGISIELIDVQTLLPFDRNHDILKSIKKTNRVLFLDEDVPGGGTAYMMQQVMEVQGAFFYLDAAPQSLTAHAHRPPYGTDGDYFSKPNAEDIFRVVYEIMSESEPGSWRKFW